MAWRGLHVTRRTRLSLADNQIVANQGEQQTRIAIEDIAWIVLDTPQVTLSTALISACMDAGIAIVTTDATHTPCGVILPFHRHHLQADVAHVQVGLAMAVKKRLWQSLVRAKIRNQASVLAGVGAENRALIAMIPHVGSGDTANTEARAARAYWSLLFADFIRSNAGDRRNALLNYGYAIVRSAVARSLVAVGLLPAFGVNHSSVTNAFNLADDLVEPFRPFVDREVWALSARGAFSDGAVTVEERRALASILTRTADLDAEAVSLLTATERAGESLVRAMRASDPALLKLPRM